MYDKECAGKEEDGKGQKERFVAPSQGFTIPQVIIASFSEDLATPPGKSPCLLNSPFVTQK